MAKKIFNTVAQNTMKKSTDIMDKMLKSLTFTICDAYKVSQQIISMKTSAEKTLFTADMDTLEIKTYPCKNGETIDIPENEFVLYVREGEDGSEVLSSIINTEIASMVPFFIREQYGTTREEIVAGLKDFINDAEMIRKQLIENEKNGTEVGRINIDVFKDFKAYAEANSIPLEDGKYMDTDDAKNHIADVFAHIIYANVSKVYVLDQSQDEVFDDISEFSHHLDREVKIMDMCFNVVLTSEPLE